MLEHFSLLDLGLEVLEINDEQECLRESFWEQNDDILLVYFGSNVKKERGEEWGFKVVVCVGIKETKGEVTCALELAFAWGYGGVGADF